MKLNKETAGSLVGVTGQTIALWHKNEGLPVEIKGRGRDGWTIDGPAFIRWYIDREVGRQVASEETDGSLEAERRRLTREQADEKAIYNAKALGQLIDVDYCMGVIDETCALLRATYAGIPSRIAPELAGVNDPAECRAIVRRELTDAQMVFAERIGKLASSPTSAGAHEDDGDPAPAENGGRVGKCKPSAATRKPGAGAVEN